MTTRTARNPVHVQVPPRQEAATLEIVWEVSSLSGRALAEAHGLHGREIAEIVLRLVMKGDRATAALDAVDRAGEPATLWSRRGLEAVRTPDAERGMVHLDVPGVLACSVRSGAEAAAVFVRTGLLEEIGAPAGSYSVRGARFSAEPAVE